MNVSTTFKRTLRSSAPRSTPLRAARAFASREMHPDADGIVPFFHLGADELARSILDLEDGVGRVARAPVRGAYPACRGARAREPSRWRSSPPPAYFCTCGAPLMGDVAE
jgi:hypothetical protein